MAQHKVFLFCIHFLMLYAIAQGAEHVSIILTTVLTYCDWHCSHVIVLRIKNNPTLVIINIILFVTYIFLSLMWCQCVILKTKMPALVYWQTLSQSACSDVKAIDWELSSTSLDSGCIQFQTWHCILPCSGEWMTKHPPSKYIFKTLPLSFQVAELGLIGPMWVRSVAISWHAMLPNGLAQSLKRELIKHSNWLLAHG